MATGGDFVIGSLRKLNINAAETTIAAFEMQDGLEVFNDLMTELEPILNMGFKPIATSSDVVRVPRGTHDAIKSMLAVRLAPEYKKPISDSLAAGAIDAKRNIINFLVTIKPSDYPDSLPKGSGNTLDDDNRFYPTPTEEDC